MRCDVLAVGTELLLGQIVDTNSSWIGEQLAANGIASHLQVKVGDNVKRIEMALRDLLADADAVIVCGGLGPTHDDVTREAIAAVMGGVELRLDETVADVIAELFAARGRRMAGNNLRQAMVPDGATVIPQTRGTAPGLICPVTLAGVAKVIYAVPGVPHEMMDMIERAVLPDLLGRSGEAGVIVSRVLKVWGESESGLNKRLDDVIERLDTSADVTLAFLSIVFGTDGESMESVVLDLMRKRGLSLGLAESLTAGLVAARLAGISGASDVLRGSVVSYASDVKFDVLGVAPGPVIGEEPALEMAAGARKVLRADVGLALTGVAGPLRQPGQEDVPVGTVCIAVVGDAGQRAVTLDLGEGSGREQIRQFSVISSLDLLRKYLTALGD